MFEVVAPAGVEPAARGLGNRCSIRLSYGAKRQEDSAVLSTTELSEHAVDQTAVSSRTVSEVFEHPDVSQAGIARVGDPLAVGRGGRGVHPHLRRGQRRCPAAGI